MNLQDTTKKPRIHRPQVLALLALQEQDCSPIELDELLGGPSRGYDAVKRIRALLDGQAVHTIEADGAAAYRLTDKDGARQLLAQVQPETLTWARAQLKDHWSSDETPPPPAVLLRRAIAHLMNR